MPSSSKALGQAIVIECDELNRVSANHPQ